MLILLYIAVDKFLHLDSVNGTIFTVRYLKEEDKGIYKTYRAGHRLADLGRVEIYVHCYLISRLG